MAQKLISIFVCNKDEDIESFLKRRAISFEKLGKSRTFIIYDEDSLEKDISDIKILGYFTLALQVLKIPENLSNRKIKKLDGFSAKINGEVLTELPVILIGQLGKNELIENNISGDKLMKICISTVLDGQYKLGGRIIMLECKNIKYLKDFYNKFGFTEIKSEDSNDQLLQYIRILSEDDLINGIND